jgi:uncharacterized membrane protein
MSTTPETPAPAAPAATTEDRTVAILCYITIIGFIVAIVMHGSKKTALGSFHLRQALGLFITGIVCWIGLILIPVVGWICLPFAMLGLFVLVIMGLIAAASGQQKPVPLLGEKYQKWFANTFT